MLSISSDAKTVKGQKFGYLTGILYLTPADGSGVVALYAKGKAKKRYVRFCCSFGRIIRGL